jgi:uncharacterized protein
MRHAVKNIPIAARVAARDWDAVRSSLDESGWARIPALLTAAECRSLRNIYGDDARFRTTVDMARHRFGQGQYRYFRYPLPRLVQSLRSRIYPRLAPIANGWARALSQRMAYPGTLSAFLTRCHESGQNKPTPLLLTYGEGGYNALHRDLYGEVAFPLQMTVFLSRPGADYEGGAFLLVEQRPRQQSVGEALLPGQGDAVLFASADRPVAGSRGFYRAGVRHGVARITRGQRTTLGVIFHDAR